MEKKHWNTTKNSAQTSNKSIKGKMNQEKAIMGQYKLNQHLIEISVGMNLMVTEIKHYCLMNT